MSQRKCTGAELILSGNFHMVAKIDDVPTGTARVFSVEGVNVALCNADGKVYAVADLCSHDGGPLGEGELSGTDIECPRHGARFDITTGAPLCLPAVRPIPTYQVELRGEEIWIGLDEKVGTPQ